MAEVAEGAGKGEDETLIEILEKVPSSPIDFARLVNYVRDPKAGAIATFEGTTRDTFDGKKVLELRYEAYLPMAVRRLRSICAAARTTWSLTKIAVAHRLGTVPVGEASVFVAVSAVHRADALDACKYVIDEIKASVPIWKKEVYENGEVWKENSEFLEMKGGALGFGGEPPVRREENVGSCRCCSGRKVRVEEGEEGGLKE